MTIRHFISLFSLTCLALFYVLFSSCGKEDWTYDEIRNRFHGEYNGQHRSDAGTSVEDFEMVEISDSISMIMGRSFDSTYIEISNIDLETGRMNMYGSDLLHLSYSARSNSFFLIRYEPEQVSVNGYKKPE